jgi:uncharacterized protein YjlB
VRGNEEVVMPEPERLTFTDDGSIPNSALPLLAYRGAVDGRARDLAAAFEELFARHGWTGSWRNGIYSFHHYHSTAHEVLGIAAGRVRVRFGGEDGSSLELEAGDAVVIPAGVGHRNERQSDDLLVVGAYPRGTDADLCRGRASERAAALHRLANLPLPSSDPVAGIGAGLTHFWSGPATDAGVSRQLGRAPSADVDLKPELG